MCIEQIGHGFVCCFYPTSLRADLDVIPEVRMKSKLAMAMFVSGALLVPLASHADKNDASSTKESVKEHVSDAWITSKIKGEFAKDKTVSATRIHVETDKGVVKLSGNAKNQDEVDRAATLAQNTKGVVSVKNELQVGTTTAGYK
jgi:osmotically-inducible protein OsmY